MKLIKEKVLNISLPMTQIPHNQFLDVLFQLIDFIFQVGNKSFIEINTRRKAFQGKKNKVCIGFTSDSLKTAVKHLIENC